MKAGVDQCGRALVPVVTKEDARSLRMLVLSRRVGEEIIIAGNIKVMVVEVKGNRVRLGIVAPANVEVDRSEVRDRRLADANPAPSCAKSVS
jgi:carbon storage regulator CsrA